MSLSHKNQSNIIMKIKSSLACMFTKWFAAQVNLQAGSPCWMNGDNGGPIFHAGARYCDQGLVCDKCSGDGQHVCREGSYKTYLGYY